MDNTLSQVLAFKNRGNNRGQGQQFTGERIPFLSVPEGKTRLNPISELPGDENKVPSIKFYRYYRLPNPTSLQDQKYDSYEVAYDSRDEFEPGYVADMKKNKKTINPNNFAWKGFMYVRNLTALKAVDLHLKGEPVNAKAFNRDVNEAKAAKVYVEQYKKALEDHESRREQAEEDPGEFVYHGIFIYNFPVTITRNIAQFIEDMQEEGEEPRLTEYVFSLTKEGKGKDTSYGFTIDYHVDEVDEDLVSTSVEFVETKELADFEGLLDRKRYKSDELEEEVKISNLSEDDDEDEDDSTTNW